MDKQLEEILYAKYPVLYEQHGLDMRNTCMCWGFEVGDGWFKLIDELSGKLTEWNNENPEEVVHATQVKEKFGYLHFYLDGHYEETSQMIREAEDKSEITCESCGEPGKMNKGGWLSVQCDKCRKK